MESGVFGEFLSSVGVLDLLNLLFGLVSACSGLGFTDLWIWGLMICCGLVFWVNLCGVWVYKTGFCKLW